MKANKRTAFLLGVSILACGALFSTSAYAERYYVKEEPIITIDKEAKTSSVKLVLQNLDTGIASYDVSSGFTGTDPETNMQVIGGGMISGGINCLMGTISCEQQYLKPVTISHTESNMKPGYVYSIGSITFKDSKNETITVTGSIKYTLDDGVIENTFSVSPPTDEALSRTYLTEAPSIEYDDNDLASVTFTVQNKTDGIKSIHYYVTSQDSLTHLVSNTRIDSTRDCSGKTEAECLELEKTPLSISFGPSDYNNGDSAPNVRSFIIEFSNGAMVQVGGTFKLSDNPVGYDNQLALELAPAEDLSIKDGIQNPQTSDSIAGAILAIGAISLVGFYSIKRQSRR